MLIRERSYRRPVEHGRYPLEALPHEAAAVCVPWPTDHPTPSPKLEGDTTLGRVARTHRSFYEPFASGACAPPGDGSSDPQVRTREIKGACYYLDADHVGICTDDHGRAAIVILVGYGRKPEPDNLANSWISGAEGALADLRAAEIAVCVAGHVRALGFDASAELAGRTDYDLKAMAVRAGIIDPQSQASPFLGHRYALAAVETNYELATDHPLRAGAAVSATADWWGINGAESGRERNRRRRRPSHMSRYPMEMIRRVPRPTTLILDNEVPRVPKRAEFFERARRGDLGAKAHREVQRFAIKHPLTQGMMPPLRALVPHQDGPTSTTASQWRDPVANARAVRSLAYHLGADLTGICEIPSYAWYSHRGDGSAIEPYHRYAVVMLIDQGYDTMEGASGDDWISGCQSMRGYLRGAEIAGVMAAFLREHGVSARPHTNADSHLLHIPLVLLAGLGELSRIGELVLNPFVGPRFKSVVVSH